MFINGSILTKSRFLGLSVCMQTVGTREYGIEARLVVNALYLWLEYNWGNYGLTILAKYALTSPQSTSTCWTMEKNMCSPSLIFM